MTDFRKGEPFCPASVNNPKKAHPGMGYSLDYNLNSRKHIRNCSELKKTYRVMLSTISV